MSSCRKIKVLITISLILIAAVSSLTAYAMRDTLIPAITYSEENLIISNGTLINGVYQKSISISDSFTPAWIFLSPINGELFVYCLNKEFLIINATSNQIIGKLPLDNATGALAFNTSSDETYLATEAYNLSGFNLSARSSVATLNGKNKVLSLQSVPFSPIMTYDSYNGALYGIVHTNKSTEGEVTVLNNSFYPTKDIYKGSQPLEIVFNPFNKMVYVSNSQSDTVTIISPNNKVVRNITVGFFPHWLSVNPTNGSVYVANSGSTTINLINPDLQVSQLSFSGLGSADSVAFDSALGAAAVTFHFGTMKLINGTHTVLGSVPVGLTPNDVIYDPVNNVLYVTNSGSGSISIIHLSKNSFEQNLLKVGLILFSIVLVFMAIYASIRLRINRQI
ncbi:MAG: YncE family protein [Thermoplasmataceae archaeon]